MTKPNFLLQGIIDVTTVANGKDVCYAKAKGWLAFFVGSGANIYDCVSNHHTFDYKDFMIGTAALITAVGLAIYAKQGDEPK